MVKTLYFTPGEYAVKPGQLVHQLHVPAHATLLGWCVDMFGNISIKVEIPDDGLAVEKALASIR